jgi:ABC-type lipoprotein release transport system permease subunit
VRLVLDEGLRNAVVATAAGVVISIVAGRFIADLLFGVSPRDPLIFASIATGVLTVSLLASLIPARRAWRIHPAEVLRNE